jgi:hypothetical protein
MKQSNFPLKKFSDFLRENEILQRHDPLFRSAFGSSKEGNLLSSWEMSFRSIGFFSSLGGRNIFGKEEVVFINVPPTETGINPLLQIYPMAGLVRSMNIYI